MLMMLLHRLVLVAAIAFAILALLEQFNPSPPPLAVELHLADAPRMPPMRLYELCPLEPRQLPIIHERDA